MRSGDLPLLDRRDQPVPAARNRFDEPRVLARILERIAKLLDRVVQTGVEVDERIRSPEPLAQLVTRDDFAGALQQDLQDPEGLFRQTNLAAGPAELAGLCVEGEIAELDIGHGHHWVPPNWQSTRRYRQVSEKSAPVDGCFHGRAVEQHRRFYRCGVHGGSRWLDDLSAYSQHCSAR